MRYENFFNLFCLVSDSIMWTYQYNASLLTSMLLRVWGFRSIFQISWVQTLGTLEEGVAEAITMNQAEFSSAVLKKVL